MRSVYRLLRLNAAVRNHHVKFAAVAVAHRLGLRHLVTRLDPVTACNLRCRMCYFSSDEYARQAKGRFTPDEIDRLGGMFFPLSMLVMIGCGAEPTLYRGYPDLVALARRHGVPNVGLVTHAQLLTADDVERLVEFGLDELVVSMHGVTRATYERFMPGASYDRLFASLDLIQEAKRRRGASRPALRVNYTVNAENLDELERFFDAFGGRDIATLQVRPVMDFGGQYRTLLDDREMDRYRRVAEVLRAGCTARGIVCMMNLTDPGYQQPNVAGVIGQAVERHLRPGRVWRDDFDWRRESYQEYCARIGWSRHLVRCALTPAPAIVSANTSLSGRYSGRYEVAGRV